MLLDLLAIPDIGLERIREKVPAVKMMTLKENGQMLVPW